MDLEGNEYPRSLSPMHALLLVGGVTFPDIFFHKILKMINFP